jgi:hypothetical protein
VILANVVKIIRGIRGNFKNKCSHLRAVSDNTSVVNIPCAVGPWNSLYPERMTSRVYINGISMTTNERERGIRCTIDTVRAGTGMSDV